MKRYVYDHALEKVIEIGEQTFNPKLHIISDTQDLLRHPVTGKYHDSKSNFRKDTKASSCDEVGNEKMTTVKTPISREKRREVLRHQLRGMTDSQAGEILNSLARQVRR